MKIDLNSKWMSKMAREVSTRNGCSFIRGIFLHYLKWGTILLIAALAATLVVTGLITQLYLIVTGQILEFYGTKPMVLYFGDEWYLRLIVVGVVISNFALIIVGTIGAAFLAVIAHDRWEESDMKLPIPQPIRNGGKLVGEALAAVHHGICPRIEFVKPVAFQGLVEGVKIRRKARVAETFDGLPYPITERAGEITKVYGEDAHSFDINVMWESGELERIEITYRSNHFFDRYEVVTVEEESSPA